MIDASITSLLKCVLIEPHTVLTKLGFKFGHTDSDLVDILLLSIVFTGVCVSCWSDACHQHTHGHVSTNPLHYYIKLKPLLITLQGLSTDYREI